MYYCHEFTSDIKSISKNVHRLTMISCVYMYKIILKHCLSLMSCKLFCNISDKGLPCLFSYFLCTFVCMLDSLFLSGHQSKRSMPKISLVCPRRCVDTMKWSKQPLCWDAVVMCLTRSIDNKPQEMKWMSVSLQN